MELAWQGRGVSRSVVGDAMRSGRKERVGGGEEGGETGTTPDGARGLDGEQGGDVAELGAGVSDGGGDGVAAAACLGIGRGKPRDGGGGLILMSFQDRLNLGNGLGLGGQSAAVVLIEGLASASEGVALDLDETLDLDDEFNFTAAVEALAGSTLVGLQLRKLRLPEAEDIGLQAADLGHIADFEVETVGDRGGFNGALLRKLRGHSLGGKALHTKPHTTRSIGQ
jgi:hypothetical protein